MANLFVMTWRRFRQPVACFSAVAFGCFAVDQAVPTSALGQEADQPSAALEALFSSEDFQISSMPAMTPTDRRPSIGGFTRPAPLRESHSSTVRGLPQQQPFSPTVIDDQASGASVQQIIGGKNHQAMGNVDNSARVVLPPQEVEKRQVYRAAKLNTAVWQQPAVATRPQNSRNHFASQASFQQQTSGNKPVAADQRMLATGVQSGERVAEMRREPLNSQPVTGLHELRNITMTEFESLMELTWGPRMSRTSSTDGRYVRVELPNRIGKRMAMLIDRQNNLISYEGDASLQRNWHQIIDRLDFRAAPRLGASQHVALVDPGQANLSTVTHATALLGLYGGVATAQEVDAATQDQDATDGNAGNESVTLPPGTEVPFQDEILPGGQGAMQGLKEKVKIVEDPDTGMITLIGNKDDLAIVRKIISEIAMQSEAAQPKVERIPLTNIQADDVAEKVQELFDSGYSSKGPAQVSPLSSPNSLIVIGQPEAIDAIKNIVGQMDVESTEDLGDGFESFRLKYISAADAKVRLDSFFGQLNQGQGDNQLPSAPVITVADFRSNIITVKGAKQFILEAKRFLNEIDVADTPAANVVKVIALRNTLAEDMAIVIQDAINGQQANAGRGYNPNQQAQLQDDTGSGQINPEESNIRSTALTLQTIGKNGEVITSGILFDVRVTADRNSNSLIVSAPAESMKLVEALIEQLDRVADAETQIKVFQILNGDAETLLTMLETLFQAGQNQQGAQGQGQGGNLTQLPLQSASSTDSSTLINLRFSTDLRTNTIIASGPAGDLQVVEDLLNRLDERDLNERQVVVHRLSNAPVLDVADAINTWLEDRAAINEADPRAVGGLNQTNREVIVVPEVVSNSLIIQARPEYLAEINEIITALDRRPPMVKVKILIAEVDLDRIEQFGVQVGVQDSLLFDRGTSVNPQPNGAISGVGFPFNSSEGVFPNQNATSRATLAGQALSNLGLGAVNSELGYGGLVLSAANESINILIRALQDKQCLRILNRPHIMTMENLQGRVIVGASVPRISGTTTNGLNVLQDIEFVDVGVIIEVTPRVSPDGMIVMAVNAKTSEVGPEEQGIVIAVEDGIPIRSPAIIEREASTTLMARHGQTVVFAGLIQESKLHVERGAPIISDLPVIGPLFKFETDEVSRNELMIIMTPYIVNDDESLDMQNNDEMDRMHWCLCDVAEVYGNTDYVDYEGEEDAVETYYPDMDPTGMQPQAPGSGGYQENVIIDPAQIQYPSGSQ